MTRSFRYSAAGIALTKKFEGLRLEAYPDSSGIWTIGYGHTGGDVHPGRQITEPEAEEMLEADLCGAVRCVNEAVGSDIELVQHEFDALVDFCFNVGRRSFEQSSLLRYVNERDRASAAHQFGFWVNVNHAPVAGLVRRRAAEAAMFQGAGGKNV